MVLPLQATGPKTFSSFIMGNNSGIVDALCSAAKCSAVHGHFIYLYGDQSSGKTHLLLASLDLAAQYGLKVRYLDLNKPLDLARAREQLNRPALVGVDHLDSIAGDAEAEKELLILIELLRNSGGALIVAGRRPVKHSAIDLPDLLSRISAWASYGLAELDEGDKQRVLKNAAKQMGFVLSLEVISWLLTHQSRDLSFLMDFLERVDSLSLAQKRRVTIPLIKTLS